jgi:hypothetical protein
MDTLNEPFITKQIKYDTNVQMHRSNTGCLKNLSLNYFFECLISGDEVETFSTQINL